MNVQMKTSSYIPPQSFVGRVDIEFNFCSVTATIKDSSREEEEEL